jgi:hypothetical protein
VQVFMRIFNKIFILEYLAAFSLEYLAV